MRLLVGIGFIAAAFAVSYGVLTGFVLLTGLHPAALAVPLALITLGVWVSSKSR